MPSCSIIILLNILEWYSYGTAVVNTEMFVPEYILSVWYHGCKWTAAGSQHAYKNLNDFSSVLQKARVGNSSVMIVAR